jgi:hypothetical protein
MIGQTNSGGTRIMDRKCILYALLLYLGATMVGLGVAYTGGIFANKASATTTSTPYSLTLVETMNVWNKTAPAQPSFYVLGTSGLTSAATLTLPMHRMIQLTIISYDTPTPGSTGDMGIVTGTVGGNMNLMNGTTATMGNMEWRQNVTSVPAAALAHTFTVPQLNINIPVVGGSTVIAYLYFDKAGTYVWICLTPCGFGAKGDQGAMSTSGWMEGQLIVQ